MINIQKQLEHERLAVRPNELNIDALSKMDEFGRLSLEEFCETGRFIDRTTFAQDNPSIRLHPECVDVVVYLCGFFIQSIKGGAYMVEMREDNNEADEIDRWVFTNESLDSVEKVLWNSRANKFFNG
jgi:hypothetical protein